MARKSVSLSHLVDTLRAFESEPITRERLLNYFQETAVDRSSLVPYMHFRPDMYTRNLIYRDGLVELMAGCWQPGQRTAIHTHNGQLGWMSVEQGAPAGVNYQWRRGNAGDTRTGS